MGEIKIADPYSGTTGHQVWEDLGLSSPCIRCTKRIFIKIDGEVMQITIEGLAALQGIPLTELPSDVDKARIAIGNGINRTMHEYAMSVGVLYTNQYLLVLKGKRDEGTPTSMAVDEIEERPKNIEYKKLLTRLTSIKETEDQINDTHVRTVKPTATTPSAGWRCYHEDDPRSHSRAQANARASAARAKPQKKKSGDGAERINQIGTHWQDEFKRIAREKGVSEKKFEELNNTHCKEGSQEGLLHALKTLMVEKRTPAPQ
jgi:hypothetical protein